MIAADATSVDDLNALVDSTMEHFGGKFDFVLHSVAMSPNIRKNKPYEDLNYDFYAKTVDISAMSFHKLLHTLYSKDALNEWGSVVALFSDLTRKVTMQNLYHDGGFSSMLATPVNQ